MAFLDGVCSVLSTFEIRTQQNSNRPVTASASAPSARSGLKRSGHPYIELCRRTNKRVASAAWDDDLSDEFQRSREEKGTRTPCGGAVDRSLHLLGPVAGATLLPNTA